MNKLELLIKDSSGNGECRIDDVMTGNANNRNVSVSVRSQLQQVRIYPWQMIDNSMYWIRLVYSPGKPLFSKESQIFWNKITPGHMKFSMNQLDKMFRDGGS